MKATAEQPADPADHLQKTIGRARRRVLRRLERVDREPISHAELVRSLGQLVVLGGLDAGVGVPPEAIEQFFGPMGPTKPTAAEGPPPTGLRIAGTSPKA